MKKNMNIARIIIITLFLSFGLVLTPSITHIVSAAVPITLADWDDGGIGTSFNLGSESGSNSHMTFEHDGTGGNKAYISTGALSGKCLKLERVAGSFNTFINFTTTFSYIHNINIWISNVVNSYIYFYNDSGIVLSLVVSGGNIFYDPVDAGLQFFASCAGENGWLNITNVADNSMNYSWWNTTGVTESDEGASYVNGDWTSITRIVFAVNGGIMSLDDILINTTYTYVPGEDLPEGYLGVNCFNESDGSNITDFNVLFVNQLGETYYDYLVNNTHIIWGDLLPQGICMVTVSKTGYYPRIYTVDIQNGYFVIDGVTYTEVVIDAYLPAINASYLYLLTVVGPPSELYENPPLENVSVVIKGLCGNTNYENVSITSTDGNGQTNVYLIAGRFYLVSLKKTGYTNKTESYIPSSTILTHTFRMSYDNSTWDWTNPYLCNEEVTFNGYINRTSKKLYLNYTDNLNKTINTKIVTYEYRSNFSTATLFNTTSKTGNSSFQINFSINNSRSYNCIIYVNHTHCGYLIRSIYFPANRTTITNQSRFELLFVLNYGSNPFGWSNTFMWLIMVACLFSFGRRETYMSAILCGFVFLFINYSIGFYTAMSVGTGVGIPILFIVMGVLMLYRDRGYIG